MSDEHPENQRLALKIIESRWKRKNDHLRKMLIRQIHDIPSKHLSEKEGQDLIAALSYERTDPKVHGHAAYAWLKNLLRDVTLARQARSDAGQMALEVGVHINLVLALFREAFHQIVEEQLAAKAPGDQACQPVPAAVAAA